MTAHPYWLETQQGLLYDLLSDEPEIDLEGLIWGCARQCRYAGQFRQDVEWYSVAEHSVHVFNEAVWVSSKWSGDYGRRFLRSAIAHDLSEGILGDITSPMKRLLPEYRTIEDRLNWALARKFDLIYPWPAEVCQIDMRILKDETNQILSARDRSDWGLPADLEPLGIQLECWAPARAAAEFADKLHLVGIC